MHTKALRVATRTHTTASETLEKLRVAASDERGEMGSWMILAAGLAAAAVAVVAILGEWFPELAERIKSSGGG